MYLNDLEEGESLGFKFVGHHQYHVVIEHGRIYMLEIDFLGLALNLGIRPF
jgi:hypothetical protein